MWQDESTIGVPRVVSIVCSGSFEPTRANLANSCRTPDASPTRPNRPHPARPTLHGLSLVSGWAEWGWIPLPADNWLIYLKDNAIDLLPRVLCIACLTYSMKYCSSSSLFPPTCASPRCIPPPPRASTRTCTPPTHTWTYGHTLTHIDTHIHSHAYARAHTRRTCAACAQTHAYVSTKQLSPPHIHPSLPHYPHSPFHHLTTPHAPLTTSLPRIPPSLPRHPTYPPPYLAPYCATSATTLLRHVCYDPPPFSYPASPTLPLIIRHQVHPRE